jgi:hypothetical protein
MMRAGLILCAALALSACATSPNPQPTTAPVCAPFRAWSDDDLKSLGQALAPIPEGSPIMRMALDWRRYYGDAKACASAGGARP